MFDWMVGVLARFGSIAFETPGPLNDDRLSDTASSSLDGSRFVDGGACLRFGVNVIVVLEATFCYISRDYSWAQGFLGLAFVVLSFWNHVGRHVHQRACIQSFDHGYGYQAVVTGVEKLLGVAGGGSRHRCMTGDRADRGARMVWPAGHSLQ